MHWNRIESEQAFAELMKTAGPTPVFLFKHSVRCSISSTVLNRLERNWQFLPDEVKPYIVDVINQRPVSNKIAQFFDVWHESPQALLIKDQKCVYHSSHLDIRVEDIKAKVKN
jgi:bacillithiol system protein YtxJ